MPLSITSEASSGGVSRNTTFTARIISESSFVIACVISFVLTVTFRGKPEILSLPLISYSSSSPLGLGTALPMRILISSAVRSPTTRLC